jgi:nitrite reductase/ring-hydroxylating ferredoxin subunit/uncharacterized membrane protein
MIGTRIENALTNVPLNMVEVEQAIKRIPGLEHAGAQLARAIHNAVLRGGSLTRGLADALHGTWFGHPLHAALTDIPIGAWALAAGFDAYAGLGGGAHAERTADSLITIGVAAAVPTALAGIADYSAIKEDAMAVGAAHALLNSAGLGLYLLSMWARAGGQRSTGVLLSTLGLAVVGASAGLGGDLIYRLRVGVNHAPPATKPAEWTAVLPLNQIAEYEARRVEIDGTPVLVYRDVDSVYAIGSVCSHAGGPLEEGTFMGHCVECPWHQSVFDLRDGKVVHGPATMGQPNYETRIRNGQIEIRLKSERAAEDAPAAGQATQSLDAESAREVGGAS